MPGEFDQFPSELMTLNGATTGAGGTFGLVSDLFSSSLTKFVIPKGMTMKLWSRLVAGPGLVVNYTFANDGSAFRTIVSDDLAATGEVDSEKRRPHVFRSSAGTEAIQITWSGGPSAPPNSVVTFDAELTVD